MAKKRNKKRHSPERRPESAGRIVEPHKKRLILPPSGIIKPKSPFERRVSDLVFRVPPKDSTQGVRLQRQMDMDVAFQLRLRKLQDRLPHLATAQMMGGSGLPMSKLLRWYFQEYLNRLLKHGFGSFPTSFNVVESFMSFNREYMLFDLRNELEHLLSINDYFRWYAASRMPMNPRILEDVMKEGTIYSYEMVSDSGSLRVMSDSQQVFAGVAFVRHEWQLSCLLLAGENPPLHPDNEIEQIDRGVSTSGRENIVPDPSLTTEDKYLDGYVGFAKVIVMSRFDLRTNKHDVRYVNIDMGRSFSVLTDDLSIFDDLQDQEMKAYRENIAENLKRYDDLFSGLASMIYLPAFFAAIPGEIQQFRVSTELNAMRKDKKIRKTIRELGESQCVMHRTIRCLPTAIVSNEPDTQILPPELEFKRDGYWKSIGPQEVGEDENGEPIVGRTWVSRHQSWSARSPKSFLLRQNRTELEGVDPGMIYVQRSPAHEINVYKIGLTRRSVEHRAQELSSATGVPLPFGVLANWSVGNCNGVERKVHERLANYRVDPRREFFRAELSLICRTVESVIEIGM